MHKVLGLPGCFFIQSFELTSGNGSLSCEGTVGAKYRVEFKDKLDDAAKWIEGDVITLTESPYLWVDRFKPIRETRYYRVVLVE